MIRTPLIMTVAALMLSACSATEPGGETRMSVLPNAKLDQLSKSKVTGKRACKRIERWYEGFSSKASIHKGAVGELQAAITTEEARLHRRGYKTVSVSDRNTTCKPTYPIGFKEWRCFSSANLCAGGRG